MTYLARPLTRFLYAVIDRSAVASFNRLITKVEAAPSDSFARGASSQVSGPLPATSLKRSHRSAGSAPGGGTETPYTWSGPTTEPNRATILAACCWRQKRRPASPPFSIERPYSSHVHVRRF